MLNRGMKLLQRSVLSLSCVMSITACATATAESTPVRTAMVERVIVQFKTTPAAPSQAVAELAQRHQLGMAFDRELGGGFYIADLSPPLTASKLQPYLAKIALDPTVASIEADLVMQTMPSQ